MQDGEHATVGSKVTLVQVDTERRVTYTLLGPWDADQKKGILSYLSPLGSRSSASASATRSSSSSLPVPSSTASSRSRTASRPGRRAPTQAWRSAAAEPLGSCEDGGPRGGSLAQSPGGAALRGRPGSAGAVCIGRVRRRAVALLATRRSYRLGPALA